MVTVSVYNIKDNGVTNQAFNAGYCLLPSGTELEPSHLPTEGTPEAMCPTIANAFLLCVIIPLAYKSHYISKEKGEGRRGKG